MVEYKYVCSSCGHAEKSKLSAKILSVVVMVIVGVLLTYFIVGMIMFGPKQFVALHTTVLMNYNAYKSDINVREFALNITRQDPSCRGDDECRVIAAYNYFVSNSLDYVYPAFGDTIYDPYFTLRTMSGDCKSVSTLFVSLMTNLGILARVDCSLVYEHCVAYVYPRGSTDYIVVDLTGPDINRFNKSTNYWDEYWGGS